MAQYASKSLVCKLARLLRMGGAVTFTTPLQDDCWWPRLISLPHLHFRQAWGQGHSQQQISSLRAKLPKTKQNNKSNLPNRGKHLKNTTPNKQAPPTPPHPEGRGGQGSHAPGPCPQGVALMAQWQWAQARLSPFISGRVLVLQSGLETCLGELTFKGNS